MNVSVLGLWHLGSVTAAATAAAGHRVRAWDPETSTVIALEGGTPPIQEPGLAELLKQQIERGRSACTAIGARLWPAPRLSGSRLTPQSTPTTARIRHSC